MTFALGGINSETAFNDVVLPDAVPPAKIRLLLFSMHNHRYAIALVENVCQPMRSIGVNGTSLNRLTVNVEPWAVTAVPRVI